MDRTNLMHVVRGQRNDRTDADLRHYDDANRRQRGRAMADAARLQQVSQR